MRKGKEKKKQKLHTRVKYVHLISLAVVFPISPKDIEIPSFFNGVASVTPPLTGPGYLSQSSILALSGEWLDPFPPHLFMSGNRRKGKRQPNKKSSGQDKGMREGIFFFLFFFFCRENEIRGKIKTTMAFFWDMIYWDFQGGGLIKFHSFMQI